MTVAKLKAHETWTQLDTQAFQRRQLFLSAVGQVLIDTSDVMMVDIIVTPDEKIAADGDASR
jgi:hypothetical protein